MTADERAAGAAEILFGLEAIRGDIESLYRELHAQPELSNREFATAERMVAELERSGFTEIHTGVGAATSVIGVLRNGDGPVVLLRADTDGLPVREAPGVEYRSTETAELDGGEVGVMHACGHDVHMAGLQATARLLAARTDAWSGTLVIVFQPAEEVLSGARAIGEALPAIIPSVDVALGQHVGPFPVGKVLIAPGPIMAAIDELQVTVHGVGGHGSMPESTVDPVVVAASIVLKLQTVVSREIGARDAAVLTIGQIHAGTKSNIIPDEARLSICIRNASEDVRARVLAAVHRIVQGECQTAGCPKPATIEHTLAGPATVNDERATALVEHALRAEFEEDLLLLTPLLASEDFGLLPDAYGAPYVFWFVGGFDLDSGAAVPTNHSPGFVPLMQPTLDAAARAMTTAALAYLAPSGVAMALSDESER